MSRPTDKPRAAPLVLVSWDGRGEALRLLQLDASPAFDLVLFDYSGLQREGPCELRGLRCHLLSASTECKGEIYAHLARWLVQRDALPEYVALIDDDVLLTVADINHTLHVARHTGLDAFSPALSHDSHFTHRWTLHRPHRITHPVDWVEVMMPFYRGSLFIAGAPYYEGNVSSWGIDKYLMPTLQRLLGLDHVAIVDAVMVCHTRPVTSGHKVFRNGLTAAAESLRMRERCLELVRERAPQLLGSAWYRRTFEQRHSRTPGQRLWLGLGRRIRQWLDRST